MMNNTNVNFITKAVNAILKILPVICLSVVICVFPSQTIAQGYGDKDSSSRAEKGNKENSRDE